MSQTIEGAHMIPRTGHDMAAGKMTWETVSAVNVLATYSTHKRVPHLHGASVGLGRCFDVEVPDDGGNDDPEHDLRKVLATADSGAEAERKKVSRHQAGVLDQPAVGQECLRRREDGGVAAEAPGLQWNQTRTDEESILPRTWVDTTVPAGSAKPMRSKGSSSPAFEETEGTTRSRRLGAAP